MQATADLQVIPLGEGVSVRDQIIRVVGLLNEYELIVQSHAAGTNLQGQMSEILAALQRVHEVMHEEGSVRLLSYLKLETRTDKKPTLADKKL